VDAQGADLGLVVQRPTTWRIDRALGDLAGDIRPLSWQVSNRPPSWEIAR